ncbi:MAG: tetratricopeptide repeat protein [Chloroflexi bacterium]|nr:MAG: tetratricopeptide repeat protein [Chloroflexota bacterium]
MAEKTIEGRIGEAWHLHRQGKNQEALKAFEDVLGMAPTHVDAHYGIGLVYRSLGENNKAIEAFKKALTLAEEAYKASRRVSEAEGVYTNDLRTNEDDRYMILTRMIKQRLESLGESIE